MFTAGIILAFVGILLVLYSIIGTLLAARNSLPINSLPMSIYKWCLRIGICSLPLGIVLMFI